MGGESASPPSARTEPNCATLSGEQLDVGNPAESFASDRDALGLGLDRDDGAGGLGEQRGRLAVGSAELGDVATARSTA